MCRADMTENVKISDNDKIFSAKFEARHICDGCGEASLALSNCQGDLDFDLLTNYPNSKFEYSNTKQLFTVLNPEREKRRTLHKIFQFRKIQRNTPFILPFGVQLKISTFM